MVMIYPAIWWGWSPPMRLITFSEDPLGNLGMFLIPSLILGTYLAAATMRMTRTMMLEVLRQDYIRTAWSKGLKERVVVVRHAVKNVLIPVVTLIGLQLPILVGGAVIIVLFVLVSVFADVLAPDPEQRQDVTRRLQGSSAEHLLGTDHTGRVLGLAYGIGSSRVIRGAVIGVKENAYFQAAQAVGSPPWRTVLRHVLPNVLAPIIVIYSITIGAVIITEASLSFLGFGLPLSVPSWGGLLSREGRNYMQQAPWLAMWPGIFLTIVVYSFNMFGDAVRDLLDPRLRGGVGRMGAQGGKALRRAVRARSSRS